MVSEWTNSRCEIKILAKSESMNLSCVEIMVELETVLRQALESHSVIIPRGLRCL